MPADVTRALAKEIREGARDGGVKPDEPLGRLCEALAKAEEHTLDTERLQREVAAGIVLRVNRWLLVASAGVGGLLLCAGIGIGWVARGQQPVPTALGPLSPRVVALVRNNDLDTLIGRAERVRPAGGGEAGWLPVWFELPPASGRRP